MPSPAQLAALAAVVPAAQTSQRKWGVPTSVTLAQWILESGWGSTGLARECHNYFGIKAHPGYPSRHWQTREVIHGESVSVEAAFCDYPDAHACFDDHGHLLATLDRYKPAMAVKNNVVHFCEALHDCGYSTLPNYAHTLLVLIGELNLQQYDLPPAK